jgi:putative membrane protein
MWAGWGFGWMLFPMLMMVVIVALCVYFTLRGRGHGSSDPAASALQLLNERFARGEISKEEFQEKRSLLERRR